jgi:S-adenosylmethionine uptake transporter
MPLDFARLPFAAAFGYVLFGEVSDAWTWAGAVIIFAAGILVTRGETKRKAR